MNYETEKPRPNIDDMRSFSKIISLFHALYNNKLYGKFLRKIIPLQVPSAPASAAATAQTKYG